MKSNVFHAFLKAKAMLTKAMLIKKAVSLKIVVAVGIGAFISISLHATEYPELRGPKGADLYYGHSSDTFIMRWHFQALCDHVFDPRTNRFAWPTSTEKGGARFDPAVVQAGDIIFVRDVLLFFEEIHPYIRNPYVMITHGECRDTCEDSYLNYLDDDRIIAWFSIHPSKSGHSKYYPIPLGIKQDKKPFLEANKELNRMLKQLRNATPKTKLLYLNFDDEANPTRKKIRELLADKDFCFSQIERIPFEDYLKQMAEFKFALSPRGWGPDCYRTWEALLVGTIPVVERGIHDAIAIRAKKESQLDKLYEGLPILVIDDWKQITEDFLEKEYRRITSKKYNLGKLYIEYWHKKIKAVRDAFLQKKKYDFYAKDE